MRALVVLILILFPLIGEAQITFYKQYSEGGSDYGQGIVQLEDSSYVVTGASSSFSNYQTDAFLLKVDSMGTVLWSNHYGGFESDWGRRVLYKQGFGFFICGYTNSIGNGAYDYYMVKTDETGIQEWEKSYGGYGWEKVHDAALTRDTGAIMVGENSSNPTQHKEIYIVRTDINGDTLWTKTFGSDRDDWATSVETYQDSTFVVGGTLYDSTVDAMRGFLMHLHEDGTIYWIDTIQSVANTELNSFSLYNDTVEGIGNYYGASDTTDIYRFKYKMGTNSVIGNLNYEVAPGLERHGYFMTQRAKYINNQRILIYGYDGPTTYPIGMDLHLGTMNYGLAWGGSLSWIAHEGPDVPGEVITTSDGGVAMVGYTTTSGLGAGNIFIWKYYWLNIPTVDGVTAVYNFVGIEDIMSDENIAISVYPNPTNDVLNITVGLESKLQVVLSDLMGKKLEETVIFNQGTINVSSLPSGMYTLSIQNDERVLAVKKVIIK